jgi:hypothetical protein
MGHSRTLPAGAGEPEPPPRAWPPRAETLEIAAAVAVRPQLWTTACRQILTLARPGWWRRWPPVPTPEPEYVRFRLQTAYGEGDGRLPAPDVVEFIAWCRRIRALRAAPRPPASVVGSDWWRASVATCRRGHHHRTLQQGASGRTTTEVAPR